MIPVGFELMLNLADTWERLRKEMSENLVESACYALDEARDGGGLQAKVLVVVDTKETKSWFRDLMLKISTDGQWPGVSFARLEENLPVKLKGSEEEDEAWEV